MSTQSISIHTHASCDTCRSAVRWLRHHNISFAEKPIYTEPPTTAELRLMLAWQGGNMRRLFNIAGLQYRALGLSAKIESLTESDAFALLSADGRLVKRPFVLGPDYGLLGFDPVVWNRTVLRPSG